MRPEILTAAGRMFDFGNPESCAIDIEEIAHALSHICRFTGHVRTFYSVAQHSVLVSRIVPPEHALAGLLHDAAEAFIGDVSAPLKQMLPDYRAIEARVEAAVLARFGLPPTLPECVKRADLIALATELRDLMPGRSSDPPPGDVAPIALRIVPLAPEDARRLFLRRFQNLCAAAESGANAPLDSVSAF